MKLFFLFLVILSGLFFAKPAHAAAPCYDTTPVLQWNGTTDDSAALAAAIATAIAQAGTGGACVALPIGTGVLCQVTVPNFSNGLTIKGAGIGATIIRPCNKGNSIFVVSNSRFLNIGEFSIVGHTQSAGNLIEISGVYNVTVHDIRAIDGWNFAFFRNASAVSVCRTDLRTFSGAVFTIEGGYDYRFCAENNYDDDTPSSEALAYMLVRTVGGLTIDGLDAIHCGNCFLFAPLNPGDSIEWVFVNQAQADTCSGNGWLLQPAAGAVIKGFQAQGIWGSSCSQNGFRTAGAGIIDGISLSNARFLTNGTDGVYFGTGSNIQISNPTISGNGTSKPGVYAGLSFGPAIRSFNVQGGIVGPSAGLPATQRNNILVASGSGKRFAIQGVTVCDPSSGGNGIYDTSGPGTKMVRNNLCYNTPDP